MAAEQFDFLGITGGRGFDLFGAGIAEETEADGGFVALLFIALKDEGEVVLAEALLREGDAIVVVLAFAEGGSGGRQFEEFIGIGVFNVNGVEEFEDFAGGNAGGGRGEAGDAARGGDIGGVAGEFPDGDEVLLLAEPAVVAGAAPMGEVVAVDGGALELGGEDFFDGRKVVEPGEDIRTALAVMEALVELFADFDGEAGDLAIEGVFLAGSGLGRL